MATMKQNPKTIGSGADLSLIQKADPRAVILTRMRDKLAGPSQAVLRAQAKRTAVRRKSIWRWGSTLTMVGLIVAANVAFFGFREEIASQLKLKRAPAVPFPRASLGNNDRALFWAYALYDFDKLRTTYGAQKGAVVDASVARRELASVLPKADRYTRFKIESYKPVKVLKGSSRRLMPSQSRQGA